MSTITLPPFLDWVRQNRSELRDIAVLTGAGISAESASPCKVSTVSISGRAVRRYYNGTVRISNILVQSFFSIILACISYYWQAGYFEIEFVT